MDTFRILVLALTAAMFLLHVGTATLLGRARKKPGVAPAVGKVLRFEVLYYAVLLIYIAVSRRSSLLVPATVLAAIHMAGLALFAGRASASGERMAGSRAVVTGVRIFDAGEAVALAWIAWLLAR